MFVRKILHLHSQYFQSECTRHAKLLVDTSVNFVKRNHFSPIGCNFMKVRKRDSSAVLDRKVSQNQ